MTAQDQRCAADHRLLFRTEETGIVIRCRTCKRDYTYTWAMLAAMAPKSAVPAAVAPTRPLT